MNITITLINRINIICFIEVLNEIKLTENHWQTFIFLQINAEDIRNIPIKISYHQVKFFIHFITLDRVNLVHLSWMKKRVFL